jgi:AmpD protein
VSSRTQRLAVDGDGIVEGASFIPSPNWDDRPPGAAIELLVIHSISLPPGEFGGGHIASLFTNTLDCAAHPAFDALRGLRVSAHFLIRRRGGLIQFVPCLKRAWHAGVSSWQGRSRCNDFSIGIELEGTDDRPFTASQYRTLERLVGALAVAYPIRAAVGHSDIAPGRKTDPGPYFDWSPLRRVLRPRRLRS